MTSSGRVGVNGLVLDIRSLGRRPGTFATVAKQIPAPIRMGLDLIAIEPQTPVSLDLQLQSVSEGVLVTGSVSAMTVGECSRCLEPFDSDVSISLTELFAYPDSLTEKTTDADEVHRISDDRIDLTQLLIDSIGIELPLQPLCQPDCQGLCAQCGERLSIVGESHSHAIIDPRWAALADKFGNLDSSADS